MTENKNNNSLHHFDHERLDVYRVAVSVARDVRRARWPRGTAHLKDNALRGAESMVLNIAEGAGRGPGAARDNHFRLARGSAVETCAVLDCLDLRTSGSLQTRLRRIGAMLTALLR